MLFPTLDFAVFFIILVLAISWLLRPHEIPWKLFLLASSYFFYGSWDARFLILIIFVTLINYVMAIQISRSDKQSHRNLFLFLALAASLGVLGFFKYYNFFREPLNFLASKVSTGFEIPIIEIILPVGISFFTFQAMSYTIDVFRKQIEVDMSPVGMLDFFVYIAFFPQLVAGPIVRARTFIPQLRDRLVKTVGDNHLALSLILGGLFKKVVLSSYLQNHIVDKVLQTPLNYSPLEILLAIYAFSVQIYCDFSGYSDIAIGVALLMGFRFPDNFNSPYRAVSITDFWRRWHITLSTWLRDYLYIPLGGNRRGRARTYINLMLTMLLGGLWHGASLSFVVWGGLHGLALAVHKFWTDFKEKRNINFSDSWFYSGISRFISIIITFHFVSFLWVFFYHKDFSNAIAVFEGLVSFEKVTPAIELYIVIAIAFGLSLHFIGDAISRLYMKIQQFFTTGFPFSLHSLTRYLGGSFQVLHNTIIMIVIIKMSPDIVPPFIYFQF
ncbi:MAG: MBOAT family protein [Spirochaetota bacterium]|nr:MBOAT family protein [Spirochaetota bacterium]